MVLIRRVEGTSLRGEDGELGELGPLIGESSDSEALAARLSCTRIALGISFSALSSRIPGRRNQYLEGDSCRVAN
jgi:hypothetical protein